MGSQRRGTSKDRPLAGEGRLVAQAQVGREKEGGKTGQTNRGGEATEGCPTKCPGRKVQGVVWRHGEARQRQVCVSSSEMSLIAGSAIMRSEFYGMLKASSLPRHEAPQEGHEQRITNRGGKGKVPQGLGCGGHRGEKSPMSLGLSQDSKGSLLLTPETEGSWTRGWTEEESLAVSGGGMGGVCRETGLRVPRSAHPCGAVYLTLPPPPAFFQHLVS